MFEYYELHLPDVSVLDYQTYFLKQYVLKKKPLYGFYKTYKLNQRIEVMHSSPEGVLVKNHLLEISKQQLN